MMNENLYTLAFLQEFVRQIKNSLTKEENVDTKTETETSSSVLDRFKPKRPKQKR